MSLWTKDFEMEYWLAEKDDYYLDNLRIKYQLFEVDKYLDKSINTAVDIGGGKFGGALYLFRDANRSILIDLLCSKYKNLGCLPKHIEMLENDFSTLSLEDDTADVVFAWNVYDHASNLNHFNTGVSEAIRILKDKGLFFGSFPLRKSPKPGHPLCISKESVLNQLKDIEILKSFIVNKPYYSDDILFIVARK